MVLPSLPGLADRSPSLPPPQQRAQKSIISFIKFLASLHSLIPHHSRPSPPPRIRSRLSSSSNFGSLRHPGHCQLLLLQQAGRPLAYPAGTHLLLTGSSSLGMYMPQKTLDWDLSIFRRSRRRPRMNVFYTAESIHTDAGDRPGGVGWKNCTRTSAGRVQ